MMLASSEEVFCVMSLMVTSWMVKAVEVGFLNFSVTLASILTTQRVETLVVPSALTVTSCLLLIGIPLLSVALTSKPLPAIFQVWVSKSPEAFAEMPSSVAVRLAKEYT